MGWLEDDVAIVTGAGSGLGRALVDRFVAEGARVVAVDRAADRVAQVESDHGAAIAGVVGDVTTAADNARAVEEALTRFGRLDTFVANAGHVRLRRRAARHPGRGARARVRRAVRRSTSRPACSGRRRPRRRWPRAAAPC